MDIKEFVKESLMQIAESINEANAELKEKGTYIPNGELVRESCLQLSKEQKLGISLRLNLIWLLLYLKNRHLMEEQDYLLLLL